MRIFDPKLALAFHAVVRNGSITAGAKALGVAQPWMSTQIRHLEDQLGFRLLIRSSRRLELTELGRIFLDYASRISEANEAAHAFAAGQRVALDNALSIGTNQFSIGTPERNRLIEHLVASYPAVQPVIETASSARLIERLIDGTLDVILINQLGISNDPRLESMRIADRVAHLLVLEDDPLAARDTIALSELCGRRLFVSSGRDDQASMRRSLAPLTSAGAELVYCPDTERPLIEAMAARDRGLCFRWLPRLVGKFRDEDRQCMPLKGAPIISPIALTRLAGGHMRKPVRAIWETARVLFPNGEDDQDSAGATP